MRASETERSRERARARMFETRSQSWREAGLLREIDPHIVRRARMTVLLLLPLFVAIVVADKHLLGEKSDLISQPLLGHVQVPIRVASVIALVLLGWLIARAAARAFGPALFRRMEPATAGTVGFLIRLVTVGITVLVALDVAGVKQQTLALGGALTAVIVGLAAQQTFGNLIAGAVLLSARPFRVGERVRLQGGALAGQVDGIVSSLGLLYTTFLAGDESIMVPNSVVLNVMVIVGKSRIGLVGASAPPPPPASMDAPPLGATATPGHPEPPPSR